LSFDITTSSPVLVVVGNSGGNVLTDAAMSSGSYNHTFTGNGQTLWYGFACTVNQTMQLDNIRLTKTTGHGYEAVVVKTADYYPGGMIMPERHTQDIDYRFGYNGMEKDDEVSGNGNSYTTEFRQYDPRLLRWKSLDPLMASYPWMSPYCAFNNNSIYYIDPYGLEGQDNIHIYADGLIYIEQTDSETDTYIYHSCEGNELVLLDNVQKIGKEGQEMVNLPRETDYYKQMLYHQGSTYSSGCSRRFPCSCLYLFNK
jgi:RHS repeat-associated protein